MMMLMASTALEKRGNVVEERGARKIGKSKLLRRTGTTFMTLQGLTTMMSTNTVTRKSERLGNGRTGFMLIGWRGSITVMKTVTKSQEDHN